MADLILEWEPLDASSVRDPAERATWASLEMTLAEDEQRHVLTRVFDRVAQTTRTHVHGTVLPLAEWLVHSWPHIFESERRRPSPSSSETTRYLWDRVHCLNYVGEGTAVPRLTIAPEDHRTFSLRWAEDQLQSRQDHNRVLFLSQGQARMPRDRLEQRFTEFLDGVSERLRARAPEASRTRSFLEALELVRREDHRDHEAWRLAARLGLIWVSLDSEARSRVQDLATRLRDGNPVARTVLELSTLDSVDAELSFAADTWDRWGEAPEAPSAWSDLREAVRARSLPTDRPAWEVGWDAARRYREALGIPHRSVPPPDDLGASFAPVRQELTNGLPADSILGWRAGRAPVRVQRPVQGRMRLLFRRARDLYPILFEGSPGEGYATVMADGLVGLRPIANAFAAELLAPVDRLRELVGELAEVSPEDIESMARELGAPFRTVYHQVENHELAFIVDPDA